MRKAAVALVLLIAANAAGDRLAPGTKQRTKLGEELLDAAFNGDRSRLETVLAHGADINYSDQFGGTALSHAIDGRHAPTVKLLLTAGANPNAADINGYTPLHGAVCGHERHGTHDREHNQEVPAPKYR